MRDLEAEQKLAHHFAHHIAGECWHRPGMSLDEVVKKSPLIREGLLVMRYAQKRPWFKHDMDIELVFKRVEDEFKIWTNFVCALQDLCGLISTQRWFRVLKAAVPYAIFAFVLYLVEGK